MPRYYCDYCDTYLTHDSPVVRKQHASGYKHKANVRNYYMQFEEQQNQTLIESKIKEFEERSREAFQQRGPFPPGGPRGPPGVFPPGMPPMARPPMGAMMPGPGAPGMDMSAMGPPPGFRPPPGMGPPPGMMGPPPGMPPMGMAMPPPGMMPHGAMAPPPGTAQS